MIDALLFPDHQFRHRVLRWNGPAAKTQSDLLAPLRGLVGLPLAHARSRHIAPARKSSGTRICSYGRRNVSDWKTLGAILLDNPIPCVTRNQKSLGGEMNCILCGRDEEYFYRQINSLE